MRKTQKEAFFNIRIKYLMQKKVFNFETTLRMFCSIGSFYIFHNNLFVTHTTEETVNSAFIIPPIIHRCKTHNVILII